MKKFCPVYSYQDSVFAVQREKENTARVNTLNVYLYNIKRLHYGEISTLLIVIRLKCLYAEPVKENMNFIILINRF